MATSNSFSSPRLERSPVVNSLHTTLNDNLSDMIALHELERATPLRLLACQIVYNMYEQVQKIAKRTIADFAFHTPQAECQPTCQPGRYQTEQCVAQQRRYRMIRHQCHSQYPNWDPPKSSDPSLHPGSLGLPLAGAGCSCPGSESW